MHPRQQGASHYLLGPSLETTWRRGRKVTEVPETDLVGGCKYWEANPRTQTTRARETMVGDQGSTRSDSDYGGAVKPNMKTIKPEQY